LAISNYRINVPTSGYGAGKDDVEGMTLPDNSGNIIIDVRNIGGPSGERMDILGRMAHELEH
jgi:hypothetical protein